jgi:hypothetical protein
MLIVYFCLLDRQDLFLDKALHVILNNSKLAYKIDVILIANEEFKKKFTSIFEVLRATLENSSRQ